MNWEKKTPAEEPIASKEIYMAKIGNRNLEVSYNTVWKSWEAVVSQYGGGAYLAATIKDAADGPAACAMAVPTLVAAFVNAIADLAPFPEVHSSWRFHA
jgi:hypothetical protein